jgi:hypothetical protein
MTVRILIALYDERGSAERARDDLIGLGIPAGDVALHAGGTPGAAVAADDPALWNELGRMRLPEADRHLYAEAVRRGGYLLVVRVPEDRVVRAADALERLDPVEPDERADRWRLSGWRGYEPAPGSAAGGPEPEAHPEPALAHAPLPSAEDPARVGGFGDSIAYAAEPAGHGTVRRRVRSYRVA